MKHFRAFIYTCLAWGALVVSVPSAHAAKPAVADVLKGVQTFYQKTKDLKGKFKQVYTDVLYNRTRESFGHLYVRKPGMMRWNYRKPERKAFISDGKQLWVYEPKDKQAFRNPLDASTLSTGITFLFGSGDLDKEFKVVYASDKKDMIGGPKHLVLKLTPKVPTAQYDYLLLAVQPTTYVVTETQIVSKHSTNHFLFTGLKFNTNLRKGRFFFRAPPGTRVIDGAKRK